MSSSSQGHGPISRSKGRKNHPGNTSSGGQRKGASFPPKHPAPASQDESSFFAKHQKGSLKKTSEILTGKTSQSTISNSVVEEKRLEQKQRRKESSRMITSRREKYYNQLLHVFGSDSG